jgi:hypothetical protein
VEIVPDETKGAHAHGLQVGVPGQCQWSQEKQCGVCPHLLVISKVVPKIWARTNSAMMIVGGYDAATGAKNGLGRKLGVVVVEEDE